MDKIREELFEISKLIAAELTGSLTGRERERLEEWRGRSEQNERLYVEMSEGKYLRDDFRDIRDADSWRALEQMRLRIESERGVVRRRRMRLGRIVGSVAAIAGLIAGIWFMWRNSGREDSFSAFSAPDYPTLTLADGNVIKLDTAERVVAADGIVAELSADRQLVYVQDSLAADTPPQIHTISVPRGNTFDIVLGDGTHVWLNAGSRISFPSRFEGGERRVSIDGEVYFDVVKNADAPFVVDVRGQSVIVHGTEFNVNSYEDRIMTTLVNGRVAVAAENMEIDLAPGEQSVFSESNGQIIKRSVNVNECISWREGYIVLEGQSFQSVMAAIGRWYDADIVWKEPSLFDMEFEGRLPRLGMLKETLDILEMTREVKFTLKGNLIEVGK